MRQAVDPYLTGESANKHFAGSRRMLTELHPSEQAFLKKEFMSPGSSVLDVGCSSGNLGHIVIEEVEESASYTGIDVDVRAIESARERHSHPNISFVVGRFPEAVASRTFDYICVFNLFEQVEDWKTFLLELAGVSSKYVNIGVSLRLHGNTVIDLDTSFGYYFDSGMRVHKIVHNMYELFNFCCISEMRVRKLSFFGYNIQRPSSSRGDFRAVSQEDEIRGNLFLELFPNNVRVNRYGAGSQASGRTEDVVHAGRPEYSIIINDEEVVI